MDAHLAKLIGYYDQLCKIGHVIDEQQFVKIVMRSVGEDYYHLVTAADCRDEDDLTLEM